MNTRPWAAAFMIGLGVAMAATVANGQEANPPAAPAPAGTEKAAGFSDAHLEQLVAPIALHPDPLLTHILMAATYPLEIVEASRWLDKNKSLQGDALNKAIAAQGWDASVKAVCAFPDVVARMNDNLDWMKDLGDAFLGQQEALLEAVQRMRAKAYDAGNLKNTEQQVVQRDEENVIIIESSDPDTIYVPDYSPVVVYGGWSYPSYYYPTLYVPPPPGAAMFTFTMGMMWGAAVVGHADWHHHHVAAGPPPPRPGGPPPRPGAPPPPGGGPPRPGAPPPPGGGPPRPGAPPPGGAKPPSWQHDPEHRKGVNYQNPSTAQKYGGGNPSSQVPRDQARGRAMQQPVGGAPPSGSRPAGGGGNLSGSRPPSGSGNPSVSTRPSGGGSPSGGRPPSGSGSPSVSTRPSGGGSSAYSGSRAPSTTKSSSSRGASSRGSSSYSGSRPSGGGSRGGGGGGRGGGGMKR